jgi:hypothetical protein
MTGTNLRYYKTLEGSLMSEKDESSNMNAGPKSAPPAGKSSSEAPPDLGKEIAKQLRSLYGRHVAEPLPEKFTVLLSQLAKAERKE